MKRGNDPIPLNSRTVCRIGYFQSTPKRIGRGDQSQGRIEIGTKLRLENVEIKRKETGFLFIIKADSPVISGGGRESGSGPVLCPPVIQVFNDKKGIYGKNGHQHESDREIKTVMPYDKSGIGGDAID
jgi:hypothetical protein